MMPFLKLLCSRKMSTWPNTCIRHEAPGLAEPPPLSPHAQAAAMATQGLSVLGIDESNPKDKIGDTKPQVWLVPPALALQVAKVMELGAKKYGAYNWRKKKVRLTVYLSAAMRHIMQAIDGCEIDAESGQPHYAHAAACMAIILDARATGNLINDLPEPGAATKLIEEMTVKTSK